MRPVRRTPSDPKAPERLPSRLAAHLRELGVAEPEQRLVVAVSGGLDSLVLLHLLRFGGGIPDVSLVAAHLDHRMRDGSAADARWLQGLAASWGVPLEVGVPERPPADQEEAREARYDFLARVRERHGARWILTAHHRDDQAETVLHRVLRGTGPTGLRGIRATAPLPAYGSTSAAVPGASPSAVLLRPLLPFWRRELEAYADAVRLRHRDDPTNRLSRYARNVIRRELLPRAEEAVAPGVRESLARLAELAEEEAAAWEDVLRRREEALVLDRARDGVRVHRDRFLEEPIFVQRRLLRRWMAEYGVRPDRAATEDAQRFASAAASGRRMHLPRGLELRRDFGELRVGRIDDDDDPTRAAQGGAAVGEAVERDLAVASPEKGGGTVRVGGRGYRVHWGPPGRLPEPRAADGGGWVLRIRPSEFRFPLRFRGWRPGDRIRLAGGRKTLAKAFGERRLPRPERGRVPVLVEDRGDVLWVPGVLHGAVPGVAGSGTGDEGEGSLQFTVVPLTDPDAREST